MFIIKGTGERRQGLCTQMSELQGREASEPQQAVHCCQVLTGSFLRLFNTCFNELDQERLHSLWGNATAEWEALLRQGQGRSGHTSGAFRFSNS